MLAAQRRNILFRESPRRRRRRRFALWLDRSSKAPVADYVSDFMSSSDGLALAKAFTTIKDSRLHRRAVDLVEEIAGDPR
jgi:hypothetical protein